jgi:hypothetical protein
VTYSKKLANMYKVFTPLTGLEDTSKEIKPELRHTAYSSLMSK